MQQLVKEKTEQSVSKSAISLHTSLKKTLVKI